MAAISPITLVFNAVDLASPILKNLVGQVQNQLGVVTQLSFAYNEVTGTLQSLASQGAKAYDLLIGQNVRLQEQLLGTKASLVATNKVLENGIQIKDPTKAIQALNEPVNQAIASLRKGSLDLVGITSDQLVPIYQLVAQNAGAVGINLEQASDLTLSFAAALGTLGIPLFQAREEINSILNGTITINTRLAKSLDINNAQVAAWKAQGVLVQKLTDKLSAFRAGNALAAQTINGVTSNIDEIVKEITRVAGEPLLAPIVAQLTNLYNYLKDNKDAIQDIAITVVNFFLGIGEKLGEVFKTLEPVFKIIGESLFKQLSAEADAAGKVITSLVDSFVLLVKSVEPLLQIIANIILAFANLASTDLGGLVIQATLLTTIIGNLALGITSVLALEFIPFLLGLVPAFIGATEAVNLFLIAIQGSVPAQVALSVFSPLAYGIADAFIAAGGGVAGFFAAAETLLAVPVIMAAIAAGTVAAAAGLVLMVKNTQDLKIANKELENFSKLNDELSDQSLDTASKLSVLNKAIKDTGVITKEQEADLKKYQVAAKQQVEILKQRIQDERKLTTASQEQKNTQETQIKQLEIMIGLLERQAGGVKLASIDLPKLGNDYQQLAEKLRNAANQFDRPASDTIFKQSAKDIVDFSTKSVEAGAISAKLAIKNLELVRNDVRVEYDERLKAQEAITKIRQTEVDRRVKIAEGEQQKIQALIANQIIGDSEGQRQLSVNKIKQLNIQLEAVKKNIADETKLRNSQINEQVKAIDTKIAEAEKRKAEAEKKEDKQGTRLAGVDIANLQKDRATAKAAISLTEEKLQKQKEQEIKFRSEISQEKGKETQRVQKELLKDFDEQQSILESDNARKLITQEKFNQESLNISKGKAAVELEQLRLAREKLSSKDTEGLQANAVQQANVRKKLADDIEKFEQGKSQIKLAKIDTEQKELAAKLSAGSVSEQRFYQASFELTKQRLQAELDEVNRQRNKLKLGDSRLDPLNAQAEDIRKRQLDAVADNQDKQVQLIEKAQKKATEIVNQSEAERNNVITTLEKDKNITQAKAGELRVDNTRKTLDSELALEKDKLNELLALPAYSDPIKEEQRQSQIRASRLKTTQLTKQLIDNEIQKRESVFKVFEDIKNKEIQGIQNQATAQTQLLDNQLKLNEYTAKNLTIQKDLISARKDLISSTASYLEGELKILGEISNSQTEQKRLAESAAEVKLKSVREQAVIERKILALNQEQTAAALEQERIQLRIDSIKARSATLTAQAEAAIVNADTTLDPEVKKNKLNAAQLKLQASQLTEGLLGDQAALLDTKAFANQREAEYSRIKLRDSSQLTEDQARLELANSRVNQGQGRSEKEQLAKEIRERRLTGDDGNGGSLQIDGNTGKDVKFIRRETEFDLSKFDKNGNLRNPQADAAKQQNLETTRQTIAQALGLSLNTPAVQTVQGQAVPQTQFTSNVPQNTIVNKDGKLTPNVGGGSFTVNITNTFNPADVASQKAANTVSNQVKKELFDIFTLAGKR